MEGSAFLSVMESVGLLPCFLFFHPALWRGREGSVAVTIFLPSLFFANRGAQTLKIRALACAAMPSARPVKPSFSVVVAFMLTRSSGSERSAATLARICGM